MAIGHEREKSVVYVLGAGASKAVIPNAPLMADLLCEALTIFEPRRDERVLRIKNFINDFYQLNPVKLPNLEDILTQLDDAIIESRPLSRQYDVSFLRKLRDDLVYAICAILQETLDHREERDKDLMKRFLYRLGPHDSILSLNYDIIVDNALFLRSGRVDYRLPVRYALQKGREPRAYKLLEKSDLDSPPLYKLHGSLNWLYCPLCQQLDVTVGFKGVRYIYDEDRDFACLDCHVRYDPLIIAPTLLKTYDNLLLREVWRQAENKVSQADEVVFIGYSMPDADVHLRCMLKRALYTNRIRSHDVQRRASSCRIRVVVNSPPNNETYERYIKLFGEIEYQGEGFQGYIEQLNR